MSGASHDSGCTVKPTRDGFDRCESPDDAVEGTSLEVEIS